MRPGGDAFAGGSSQCALGFVANAGGGGGLGGGGVRCHRGRTLRKRTFDETENDEEDVAEEKGRGKVLQFRPAGGRGGGTQGQRETRFRSL